MKFTDKIELGNSVEYKNRFPNIIKTDRLTLKGPINNHVKLQEMFDFHTGEHAQKMCKPLNIKPYKTVEDARQKYEKYVSEWKDGSAAYYAIFENDRSDGYQTPFCGFAFGDFNWDNQKAYIGIWLHPTVWGNSYSAERAEALLEMIYNSPVGTGIEVVEVFFEPSNEKSESAVEKYINKLGGEFRGLDKNKINLKGRESPMDMKVYQITRDNYHNSKD